MRTLKKNVAISFIFFLFGCYTYQINSDIVMKKMNGKIRQIKKYNLNDTLFPGNIIEYTKYDYLNRLLYKGYSEISAPDSILRFSKYDYSVNSEIEIHYEGNVEVEKRITFKEGRYLLEISEVDNMKDTLFFHKVEKNGRLLLIGEYKNKGKFQTYKKFTRDGKIKEIGRIKYLMDSTIKKVPLMQFKYNNHGCLVESESLNNSYTTRFRSDMYCNELESFGIDSNGLVKDKEMFINILDQHNNWIKRYCLNSKNDTMYIQIREIEYQR